MRGKFPLGPIQSAELWAIGVVALGAARTPSREEEESNKMMAATPDAETSGGRENLADNESPLRVQAPIQLI